MKKTGVSKHRVIYMEIDPADGRFKNHIAASQGGGYSAGELFITSPRAEPFALYDVLGYRGDASDYEEVKRIAVGGDGSYVYRLVFGNAQISARYSSIDFRAYPLNAVESTGLNTWILFELKPTPAILDVLEEQEDYNLVGDVDLQ